MVYGGERTALMDILFECVFVAPVGVAFVERERTIMKRNEIS